MPGVIPHDDTRFDALPSSRLPVRAIADTDRVGRADGIRVLQVDCKDWTESATAVAQSQHSPTIERQAEQLDHGSSCG
jgi:hypothetical protein